MDFRMHGATIQKRLNIKFHFLKKSKWGPRCSIQTERQTDRQTVPPTFTFSLRGFAEWSYIIIAIENSFVF
jgi:hypothetical protein